MADQLDGNLASKGKKGKLTNSQLRLLGFVAACGADGSLQTPCRHILCFDSGSLLRILPGVLL